ncbi:BON domain-containing protein [Paenochrobactrum sp. BZR 588]|uniref:BON domain-containing protein n=1 Tax=unclassified Paenochrobactrum TaxID=2639760 RepID=UPI00385422A8
MSALKQWFWPGWVCTVTLTAVALWFGIKPLEAELAQRTQIVLQPYDWTSFSVEGRDLTLRGVAPDEAAQKLALEAAGKIEGIREIENLTSLLPLAAPYTFQIEKNGDGIILSGHVPTSQLRDELMLTMEENADSMMVMDEMALARGQPDNYATLVKFAILQSAFLKSGKIALIDMRLNIDGDANNRLDYYRLQNALNNSLPEGAEIGQRFIAQP